MKEFILFLLGLNLALGFVRIFRGPSVVDSMLASLLLGTGGTSLILALYKFTGQAFLLNLALGFALLAGVVGVAFAIIMLRDAD
ncbi:hypothetical protein IAE16_04335 [Hydrogenobacter sp. T-2]|uniref:hypothetical protein n=1 Tax=Pampinifervens diazotrophicum TaxID=1632018 RepID=UPI002B25F8E7|nr:hypothetical protein [Hydrogenobacter sp. T-2]WPM32913.1 hypothetical protein IAE16_04335 [Hydrogenobacter sp. T-2]